MKRIKITKIKTFIIAFVMILTSTLYAQITQWTQTYGGPGDDGSQSMIMTNDGGIVITGFKSTAAYSYTDILLMKTDVSGNTLWSRTYNLHLNDIGRSVRQTSDGGFIITGRTEVSAQIYDPFLIKTDSAGNVQWIHQYDYGNGYLDMAHSVWQTTDGGYIVAGQTWILHGAFSNSDIYIFKTDMNGDVQWKKTFFREEDGGDAALAIQQLGDGGYIIGGFTQSSSWASYIIRTDSSGNAIWSNIYPGSWQSECYDIKTTPDGGFIFTGTETSYETDADLLIMKLDANGNMIWKKIYGTADSDDGRSIRQLPDGGYIIAGLSAHGAGGYDMYVVRTNAAGDMMWTKTIGGTGDDRAFSVVSPQAGSYYVTGWAWSYGQGQGDVYLVKLTESLTGNIGSNSVPESFYLSQNFPNPFNPATTIKFGLTKSQAVSLTVYDASGRSVEQLINSSLNAGTYEITWDASKYSSGIYFYTFRSNNFSQTKKMMMVK